MWYNTRASKILNVKYPILQGPFGGNLSSVKLTATVSNLGGVGGYGAYTLTPDELSKVISELNNVTDKPYNINLWVSDSDVPSKGVTETALQTTKNLFKPYFDELEIAVPDKPLSFASRFENQMEVILHAKPPVFSFMFGIPSTDILKKCKSLGIVTIGAATTLDEAIALDNADVDLIIASGFEAGGHRPSFLDLSENSLTGTFALVQLIKEKVKRPVIAAGGIATGNGIAAAFALGADAVQIGTAFLACEESNALPVHREILFSAASQYTTLTRAFTGRLGRGIRNKISDEINGREAELLPFPLQTQFMASLRQEALAQKKLEMVLFWGGQVTPLLKHKKAGDLLHALVEETTAYYNKH